MLNRTSTTRTPTSITERHCASSSSSSSAPLIKHSKRTRRLNSSVLKIAACAILCSSSSTIPVVESFRASTSSITSTLNSLNTPHHQHHTQLPTSQQDLTFIEKKNNYISNNPLFSTYYSQSRYSRCRIVSRATKESDVQYKSLDDGDDNDNVNGRGSNSSRSRFGVRSRVKSVLRKARNRTGIDNNSDTSSSTTAAAAAYYTTRVRKPSTQSVISDAASIGGLGAVVVDDFGTVDVALDYDPPPPALSQMNGSTLEKASSSKTDLLENDESLSSYYNSDSKEEEMNTKPVQLQETKIKTKPASTYSPPDVQIEKGPEDLLRTSSSVSTSTSTSSSLSEKDAFTGDAPAAFSLPASPLPFTLPKLSNEQERLLKKGERIQFQSDMGREGSGYVVVDVKAPADVVWDCLLDFESYPETIPTVREVQMLTNTHLDSDYRSEKPIRKPAATAVSEGAVILKHGVPSVTRASFSLSKFRLKIAAIHKYRPHPKGDYMVFTLDPACTNLVLQKAKGVWHTQENLEGRPGITRVWLLCELKVSKVLPIWIVDYAAKRAMPRATTWLKPQVETAASLWLRKDTTDSTYNN
eukprot:CAMPEP_0178943248 /NCGR_PEP_ID=MMETSP0789-20121207/2476_1 /TAXON_ID=3005 /ORGANISM="Rhizosolenia setigera, Strain CCMP 1694" /LENGTH=582 /DNA_ID=CAMNT_0020622811 /DNA_START=152 /DNA_END=1900 /DNA_ORIENTATION=+